MKGYKQFLDKDRFNEITQTLKVTKVKKTLRGFIIHAMTNYITLYYKYVTTAKNGTAKVLTKVDQNYRPNYQYTIYENSEGVAITLNEFRKLNK